MTIYVNERPLSLLINTMASFSRHPVRTPALNDVYSRLERLQLDYKALTTTAFGAEKRTGTKDVSAVASAVYEFLSAQYQSGFKAGAAENQALVIFLSQEVIALNDKMRTYKAPLYSILFDSIIESEHASKEAKYFILFEMYQIFLSEHFNSSAPIASALEAAIRKCILEYAFEQNLSKLKQVFSTNKKAKLFLSKEDYSLNVEDEFGRFITLAELIAKLEKTDPCPQVAILGGPEANFEKITSIFNDLRIQFEAHTIDVSKKSLITYYARHAHEHSAIKTIIVVCANDVTLAEVCAENSPLPVIGVPISGKERHMKGLDIQSALLEISGMTTVRIDGYEHAAESAAKTVGLFDENVHKSLHKYKKAKEEHKIEVASKQGLHMHDLKKCSLSPIQHPFKGPNDTEYSNLTAALDAFNALGYAASFSLDNSTAQLPMFDEQRSKPKPYPKANSSIDGSESSLEGNNRVLDRTVISKPRFTKYE